MDEDYENAPVSLQQRRRKTLLLLGVIFILFCFALWTALSLDDISQFKDAFFPLLLGFSALAYFAYRYWHETEKKVLTPHGREKQAEEVRQMEEAEDKWYVRYSFAALCLWGALYLVQQDSNRQWLAIVLIVGAAYYAREVTLWAVGLGFLYWIVLGVASLPTGAAIILGAIIIAAAVSERGR